MARQVPSQVSALSAQSAVWSRHVVEGTRNTGPIVMTPRGLWSVCGRMTDLGCTQVAVREVARGSADGRRKPAAQAWVACACARALGDVVMLTLRSAAVVRVDSITVHRTSRLSCAEL